MLPDDNDPIQGMVGRPHNAQVTVTNPTTPGDHVDLQYRFRIRSKQETTDKTSGWVYFNSSRPTRPPSVGVEMQPNIVNDIPNGPTAL